MAKRFVVTVPEGTKIADLPEAELEKVIRDAAEKLGIAKSDHDEVVVETVRPKAEDYEKKVEPAIWLLSWSRHGLL